MKLALVSGVLAAAVVASLAVTTSVARTAPSIRNTDFRNFSYAPSCLDSKESVRVHNGSFCGHTRGGTDGYDFLDFTVERIAYGALTRDGQEQAVVVTRCNTGGSGVFTSASIYEMWQGKPVLVTMLQGGDRADGGIASVKIKDGLLQVGRYGTNGGMCCPEWIDTATYRLVDRRLVEVGRRVRKAWEESRGR